VAKLDLALTDEETETFLLASRTVRLATVDGVGHPLVVPLWFVWHDGTLFMNTTVGNRSIRNLEAHSEAAGCVDDGETYDELRGVVLTGPVQRMDQDPRLDAVKALWSQKYLGGNPVPFDRWIDRVWLRMVPERVSSWDFRKIPEARARAAPNR
jgi:nitroimidazol reductase NimA-like FMN-containing flavoprotein (pyridoxamine 5'-phosphate oxidase superfamily)